MASGSSKVINALTSTLTLVRGAQIKTLEPHTLEITDSEIKVITPEPHGTRKVLVIHRSQLFLYHYTMETLLAVKTPQTEPISKFREARTWNGK